MTEIEKMKRYIKRTGLKVAETRPYQMNMIEAFELACWALDCGDLPIVAISLAFDYGMAKGYRAAEAERKKASA